MTRPQKELLHLRLVFPALPTGRLHPRLGFPRHYKGFQVGQCGKHKNDNRPTRQRGRPKRHTWQILYMPSHKPKLCQECRPLRTNTGHIADSNPKNWIRLPRPRLCFKQTFGDKIKTALRQLDNISKING
jgi:hypothetical protein